VRLPLTARELAREPAADRLCASNHSPRLSVAAVSVQARSVLGSAQPLKVSLRKLREVDEERKERLRRKRAEAKRLEVLKQMRDEMATHPSGAGTVFQELRARIEKSAAAGFGLTRHGERRGVCLEAPSCTGFTKMLHLPTQSKLWHYCACCGCDAFAHEKPAIKGQTALDRAH
jgi:hypothetical protein